jgi:hypothetical protein
LDALSLGQFISLLSCHEQGVHRNHRYQNLTSQKIVELFASGLDKGLSEDSSELILETLKLVYDIDTNHIVSNPLEFECVLRRMIGRQHYKIIHDVAQHMRKEVLFCRYDQRAYQ